MLEKKEKKVNITINLAIPLYKKLKKIKGKTKRSLVSMIRDCLSNPININGIAKRERVKIKLDPCDGTITMTVDLSEATVQKLEEIKSFHPGFSRSTTVSLCLLKKEITIDNLLRDIENLYIPLDDSCRKVGGPIPQDILKSIREVNKKFK